MPFQIGRRVRTKQPQQVARIDWAHFSSPCLVHTGGITHSKKLSVAQSYLSKSAGIDGIGVIPTQLVTVPNLTAGDLNIDGTKDVSILVLVDEKSVSASRGGVFSVGSLYGAYDNAIVLQQEQSDRNVWKAQVGGLSISPHGYGELPAPEKSVCWSVRRTGTTLDLFRNGVLDRSATGSAGNIPSSAAINIAASVIDGTSYLWSETPIYLVVVFNKFLSDAEIKSLSANPWQIFEPEPLPWFIPGSGTSPQLLAPTGEISGSTWIASNGGTTYSCVDEAVADGADFAYTLTPGAWVEWSFDAPDTGHNGSAAGGYARYQLPAGSGSITVTLRQGATVLETYGPHTLTGSTQDFAQLIAATTSNSTDLRLRFTAS